MKRRVRRRRKRVGSYHEEDAMSGDEEEMWKRHFALIEESERLVDELQVKFYPSYLPVMLHMWT